MTDPIVEARNVHKSYRTEGAAVPALRGVDLTVRCGEMVAVTGPSGCGKTTLIHCLSGLDAIDQGTVVVEGRRIHELPDRQRTRYRSQRMGIVFQAYNLIPVLTAAENVELPLLLAGTRPRAARRQALAALERVGLAELARRRPAQLSGGQQQRVAIARGVVNRPAILWADEPTGALDSAASAEVMELLSRLNRQLDQTVVLVTHDAAVARRAHRTLHMRDGRMEHADELAARRAAASEVGS